jgi:hypothetical protein
MFALSMAIAGAADWYVQALGIGPSSWIVSHIVLSLPAAGLRFRGLGGCSEPSGKGHLLMYKSFFSSTIVSAMLLR